MTNNKVIYVSLVVIALLALGGYYFPKSPMLVGAVPNTSSTGTTNSARQFSSIVMNPSTGTATSSFLTNTSGTDRIITDEYVNCSNATTTYTAYTGAGLANFLLRSATTTTANIGTTTDIATINSNWVANIVVPTSTSATTGQFGATPGVPAFVASSTEGQLVYTSRIWPAGSVLMMEFNATSSATCTVVHDWFTL